MTATLAARSQCNCTEIPCKSRADRAGESAMTCVASNLFFTIHQTQGGRNMGVQSSRFNVQRLAADGPGFGPLNYGLWTSIDFGHWTLDSGLQCRVPGDLGEP